MFNNVYVHSTNLLSTKSSSVLKALMQVMPYNLPLQELSEDNKVRRKATKFKYQHVAM